MSLPELFRHRDRFVGCIALSRVPRRRVGETLRAGTHSRVLDPADVDAFDAIATASLHRAGDETFYITAQGYDYPSLSRCPALLDDGRCAIHRQGKPVTCEVVPLDPLIPDHLQALVLASRKQSALYLGADCIREGVHDGHTPYVAQNGVEDRSASDALARRRASLAEEYSVWGRAVFEALRKEIFDSPDALARIPVNGFMTISLVPALLSVASASAQCRDWCIDYISSQIALIERNIGQAVLRRRLDDRPTTRELRNFANAYQRAYAALSMSSSSNGTNMNAEIAARTERYLRGTRQADAVTRSAAQ